MAPVTTIAEIGKHEGQTVTIRGWLYNLRESGKLLFPIFRDGSGVIQGVVPKSAVPPEVFDAVKASPRNPASSLKAKSVLISAPPAATNLMFPAFKLSSACL